METLTLWHILNAQPKVLYLISTEKRPNPVMHQTEIIKNKLEKRYK